jgi:FdhD protein
MDGDKPRYAPLSRARATAWRIDGAAEAVERDVPEEVPIGLTYDGRPHVVLMATPADLEDLAYGFTLTEKVAPPAEIVGVAVEPHAEGITVDAALTAAGRKARAQARTRLMEARSSCGLCGVQTLSAAVRGLEPSPEGLSVSRAAIQRALGELEEGQAYGKRSRAMHAAAWFDPDGALRLVREDVGRHNALDKLIGGAFRAGLDPRRAFIVVTSRLSYEMVEKAAAAGVSILVAISAPTALALRKAEDNGLTLVALARPDGHAVFTRPDRIRE